MISTRGSRSVDLLRLGGWINEGVSGPTNVTNYFQVDSGSGEQTSFEVRPPGA